jgi:hypothetical protein
MLDSFLVPEKTVVTAKGDSAAVDVSTASSPVFLVTLSISAVVEQESIDIALFTSADGATWDAKAAAMFPQKFYTGEFPLLLDLSSAKDAKFLRAHWEVNRWGRGRATPSFEFSLRVREVPQAALLEAIAEAQTGR